MNSIDVMLSVLAGLLVLLGLIKGLVRLLVGILALATGFVVAALYHQEIGERLAGTGWSREARYLAGFVLLFVGVMLVGGLVAWLVRKLVKAAMLDWADRLAGAALGFVAAGLLAGIFILPLVAYTSSGGALRESRLAPYAALVADLARVVAPADLARRYDEKMDELRRYWRERPPVAGATPARA